MKSWEWDCWIKECDYICGPCYLYINENNSKKETRKIMCQPILYFPQDLMLFWTRGEHCQAPFSVREKYMQGNLVIRSYFMQPDLWFYEKY